MNIHHVQLSIPAGGEEAARRFWVDVLGFSEIAKPPALAVRGGAWFRLGDVEVHLGVEEEFRPARKAHPAFSVEDLGELDGRLTSGGFEVRPDGLFPGRDRLYTDDPFGNRIEFLGPAE